MISSLDTGDVLLFYMSGIPACLARSSLNSHWDHVAFVIRRKDYSRQTLRGESMPDEQQNSRRQCKPTYCTCRSTAMGEQLELLEATSSGVHVYNLEERIARVRSHYKVVAVRRLTGFERNRRIQEKVEDLVRKVRGRAYQFMNFRIFKMGVMGGTPANAKVEKQIAKTLSDGNNDVNEQTSQGDLSITSSSGSTGRPSLKTSRRESSRVFSIPDRVVCSELAAAGVMAMKVIDPRVFHVDEFGPNSFSTIDSGDLLNKVLVKGARYESEIIFHYPGGPYGAALEALHKLMKEKKTVIEDKDHMSVTERLSSATRRLTRFSKTQRIVPLRRESDEREPRHFSSKYAIGYYNSLKRQRSSIFQGVLSKMSSRFSSGTSSVTSRLSRFSSTSTLGHIDSIVEEEEEQGETCDKTAVQRNATR